MADTIKTVNKTKLSNGEVRYYEDTQARTDITNIKAEFNDLSVDLESKQDKLTAGDNITISSENVISSAQLKDYNQLENKPTLNGVAVQGNLLSSELNIHTSDLINDEGFLTGDSVTAGDGIEVEKTPEGISITNTQKSAEWGNISGDIESQADLIEYIDDNGCKIDSISVNHVQQQIDENKNVNITVPIHTSDLVNDGEGDVDSEGNPITYVLSDELDILSGLVDTKQDILTSENAGSGIEIATNSEGKTTISSTNVSAEWGNIQGNIDDQLDLSQKLSGKQDELVPGDNININVDSEGSPVISVIGLSEVASSGDYADLMNKPTVNNVEIEGDLSLDDLGIQDVLTQDNAGSGIQIVNDSEGRVIISTTAEENVIEVVKRNGVALEVVNKSVDVSVPTTVAELSDASNYVTDSDFSTALEGKVDKEAGKGLSTEDFTAAEKTKLAGIEDGAEVNVNADWNATDGDAEILNKPTTVAGYGITDTYTKTEADTLLGKKQDVLTAGDNITIKVAAGHELPAGYTEVEYIQSSGTQYINTGVNGQTGVSSEVTFEYTALPNDLSMLAARDASTRIYLIHSYPAYRWCYGYGNYYVMNSLTLNTNIIYHVESKLLNGEQGIWIDRVPAGAVGTNTTEYNVNQPLYLFCMNNNGNAAGGSSAKLYECKIYFNDVLQRHFVPCIQDSNSEVGLYDLVSESFFGNNGTGAFTAGDAIQPGTVISAVDTAYTAGIGLTLTGTEFSVDTSVIAEVSDIPTNVSELTNDSGYITGVAWGDITGTLSNQTDLQDALDSKQDELTAGTDLAIQKGTDIVVPSGYTVIEYIQATGTQAINTDIAFQQGLRAEIDFQTTELSNSYYPMGFNDYIANLFYYNGNYYTIQRAVASQSFSVDPYQRHVIELVFTDTAGGYNSLTATIEDETKTVTRTAAGGTRGTFAIFAVFGTSNLYGYSKGKLYRAKFYDSNDTLLMDLVPVKNSSNVPGMYDLVGDTFYGNAGTSGNFVAGPEMGSQTLIYFTNETGYITDNYYTGVNGITITKSSNSATIGLDSGNLILDCGTSTLVV